MIQTNFCSADLEGVDKPGQMLSQFIDYELRENSNRWKGQEDFLTTGDLRTTWEAFFSARPQAALAKSKKAIQFSRNLQYRPAQQPTSLASTQKTAGVGGNNVVQAMYFEDICVNFNMGRCLKAPGTCTTKRGRSLRHICNFRPNPANPAAYCGANHTACHFH